mgnify:FL=1
MANVVRYLRGSVLDDATVAVSSQTAGLPGNNVKDKLIRKVYRTTGRSNEWVRFKASGGATGINVVFLGRHNFTKNAVVLWQGNTTSNFGSGPALNITLSVVTDALGSVVPKICYFRSAVASYLHWRLYVRDSGNASTNLEIGRIATGRYVEPTQNVREGFTMRYIDPSRRMVSVGRQGYANTRPTYQEFSYSVGWAKEDQQDQLIALYRSIGQHTAFVFSLDPETRPSHNSAYVEFTEPVTWQSNVTRQKTLQDLTLSEKN